MEVASSLLMKMLIKVLPLLSSLLMLSWSILNPPRARDPCTSSSLSNTCADLSMSQLLRPFWTSIDVEGPFRMSLKKLENVYVLKISHETVFRLSVIAIAERLPPLWLQVLGNISMISAQCSSLQFRKAHQSIRRWRRNYSPRMQLQKATEQKCRGDQLQIQYQEWKKW